ncbi:glycosyltransferase family 2 protein [Aquabacterium sp. J223]|uniref:glycosyltransferase family 2 protein n=1 Tax=Aquabacterium sp. J223 TaxID=2898431 RepID=UPI0021AE2DFE|nr:glycosyltransferase [Aquabacterium sp. J223]UUX95067.1 glycosyltransferase [Aquabacterium sp. J223]
MPLAHRLSIVVLTHNRRHELVRCLRRLQSLPESVPIVVVDNGSTDGTAQRVHRDFPAVRLVRSERNLGAAARNLGVEAVATPYVAFCDDDTWWAPGALTRAALRLDAHPRVVALSAQVRVGAQNRRDPTCDAMAASPLPSQGLPGPALVGFMAGAAVVRVRAFRDAGGYEPRFFLGGEEALLGLDLLAAGGAIVYADDIVTHHHPSASGRDPRGRHLAVARNRLWLGWLRLPWAMALADARLALGEAARQGVLMPALARALAGLPWALARRRVVPAAAQAAYRAVHRPPRGALAAPATACPPTT